MLFFFSRLVCRWEIIICTMYTVYAYTSVHPCVHPFVTQFPLKLLQLHIFGKLLVLMNCGTLFMSADIMSSLCGVGIRVRVNNFFSKTTRPRDMLFFLKDTLSIEDEKLFKACKSVCSSVC